MAIKVNNTNVSKVLVNGQEINIVKVNNTIVYTKQGNTPPPPPTNKYVWEIKNGGFILCSPTNTEPRGECREWQEGICNSYNGNKYVCTKV